MTWRTFGGAVLIAIGAFYAGNTASLRLGQAKATDDATVKLFRAQCATCHGVDGKGKTTAGKELGVLDWSDGKTIPGMSDAQIEKVIREGSSKGKDGKTRMPPFPKLSGEQIKALVAYVRTLK